MNPSTCCRFCLSSRMERGQSKEWELNLQQVNDRNLVKTTSRVWDETAGRITKDLNSSEGLEAEREEAIKHLDKDTLEKDKVFIEQLMIKPPAASSLQKKSEQRRRRMELSKRWSPSLRLVMSEESLPNPPTLKAHGRHSRVSWRFESNHL